MALALEGNASVIGSGAGTASKTINVTTSGTDRIIIVSVHNEKDGSRQTVSNVAASGLTFVRRFAFPFASSTTALQNMEVWWAYAAAQQTAKTITVTLSADTDDMTIRVFAVSGVDPSRFTNPWAVATPPTASNPTTTQVWGCVPGVTTTAANTIVFAWWGEGISNVGNHPDVGATWSTIDAGIVNTGGVNVSLQWLFYKAFTSIQTNLTANAASGAAPTRNWGMIADAITSDVGTVIAEAAQTIPAFTQAATLTTPALRLAVASQIINAFPVNVVRQGNIVHVPDGVAHEEYGVIKVGARPRRVR